MSTVHLGEGRVASVAHGESDYPSQLVKGGEDCPPGRCNGGDCPLRSRNGEDCPPGRCNDGNARQEVAMARNAHQGDVMAGNAC